MIRDKKKNVNKATCSEVSPGSLHVWPAPARVEASLRKGERTSFGLQLVLHLHQTLLQLALFLHQLCR